MTTAETITGTVEARNERGIRVAGEWRNLSKFRPLELPDVGAEVVLRLDPKGFITSLEVLDDDQGRAVRPRSRDQTIVRLQVLQAAAAFGAARAECKSLDVLAIASRWLEWVES